MNNPKSSPLVKLDTLITHAGSYPEQQNGAVNPPVYHASTFVFPNVSALEGAQANRLEGVRYGRLGTPTTRSLETAIAELEGGYGAMVLPSGLSAAAVSLLACTKQGDHVLMTDTVYGPTRNLCKYVLPKFGIETTFFDPLIGEKIGALIQPNTKVVYLESPGSLTFEVQDVPAIAKVAHKAGAIVMLDNTWGTPLLFRSFEHGVDVSIHAGTKYIAGHSDVMLGLIVTSEMTERIIRNFWADLGMTTGPDDVYLALRGLRTLSVRLQRHMENALKVASWLRKRQEVAEVLYPALPGARGHALWERDFKGACGLFSVVLNPVPKQAVDALLDSLHIFGMGWSWGGYESLILPINPAHYRSVTPWDAVGPVLRLHIGLEDSADLIADLEQALAKLRAAV